MFKKRGQKHKSANSKTSKKAKKQTGFHILQFLIGIIICISVVITVSLLILAIYDETYSNLIYPGVTIANITVGGTSPLQVKNYWLQENQRFANTTFTFVYEDKIATLSAQELDVGYDATLSATQAYNVGRSGNFFSDSYHKFLAWQEGINLSPLFRFREGVLDETLSNLAQRIDLKPDNALFEFSNGRVTTFKPGKNGRQLNIQLFQKRFADHLNNLAQQPPLSKNYVFMLPVDNIEPTVRTEQVNNYGIKELIGKGESFFRGSIAGRIHNIALAASRVNGVLIPPQTVFSFNDTVGDISAATGYKQAYVIKSGRTVLDDGGGVCQVSTTVFRAALNSGLPIIERFAHSYRVAYYEQGGWKPGFDATVYDPTYDLKFKNDTQNYILIQAKVDLANLKLTFEFYGTKDDRSVEISPVRLWDAKPAPPDLNQDDPTLPNGTVKQVDWAAPGIKAAFDYTVKKGNEVTFSKTFFSNFIPWQAVYLHGTAPQ